MIEIHAIISTKPVQMKGYSIHRSERSVLPVTKIKNDGSKTKPSYSALVYDHKINAPHNDEHPAGEVWVLFRKSENKSVKLPVLSIFETADV